MFLVAPDAHRTRRAAKLCDDCELTEIHVRVAPDADCREPPATALRSATKSEPVGTVAMIICSCNVLSDLEVKIAVAASKPPRTIGRLFRYLGCTAQCGRCGPSIKGIVDEARRPANAHRGGLLPTR
jgi:bacterioferritin-associated ferredoxin